MYLWSSKCTILHVQERGWIWLSFIEIRALDAVVNPDFFRGTYKIFESVLFKITEKVTLYSSKKKITIPNQNRSTILWSICIFPMHWDIELILSPMNYPSIGFPMHIHSSSRINQLDRKQHFENHRWIDP